MVSETTEYQTKVVSREVVKCSLMQYLNRVSE